MPVQSGAGRLLWGVSHGWNWTTGGRLLSLLIDVSGLPVTVKCRIGIDDMDPEAGLDHFVDLAVDG